MKKEELLDLYSKKLKRYEDCMLNATTDCSKVYFEGQISLIKEFLINLEILKD